MDPINTRLLKKLLRTLEGIERHIKTSIDQKIDTHGEYKQPEEKQDRQHAPIKIRSELQLPVAIREYCESENRESQSKWRKFKGWLELGGLVIAIVLAILTYLTLRQTGEQAEAAREQVTIMQKQLEATDRPWMKITGGTPINDLKFTDMGKDGTFVSADVAITAKNIGKTVALNIAIHGRMTLTEDGDRLDKEQMDACNGPVTFPGSLTAFPGDDTGNDLIVLGIESLPAKIKSPVASVLDVPYLASEHAKFIEPKYISCITYTYGTSRAIHYSGFRFTLAYVEMIPKDRINDFSKMLFRNNKHTVTYFVVGDSISYHHLFLSRFLRGFDAT